MVFRGIKRDVYLQRDECRTLNIMVERNTYANLHINDKFVQACIDSGMRQRIDLLDRTVCSYVKSQIDEGSRKLMVSHRKLHGLMKIHAA